MAALRRNLRGPRKKTPARAVGAFVTIGKAPCKSCPYRQDVPSGIWAASEYDKLPSYDGSVLDQTMTGAMAAFYCHQQDGKLCAGWIGCHGAGNLLAMRLMALQRPGTVDPVVWDYTSPVPLFASGEEAAQHGRRDIKRPSDDAQRMVAQLLRKRTRKA